MGFWSEHCPARPADLNHRHDMHCPDRHPRGQCCECLAFDRPLTPPVPEVRAVPDHTYRWTMAGYCAACGGVEDGHPLELAVQKIEDCEQSNHDAIKSQLLIGDGGLEWTTCGSCGRFVEPKMATGVLAGKAYEKGRGPLIERMKQRLNFVAYLNGYGR